MNQEEITREFSNAGWELDSGFTSTSSSDTRTPYLS
jgi:hypothetical protein